MDGGCVNCGGRIYARQRCEPCYRFVLRHAVERPETLAVSKAIHDFERDTFRDLVREALRHGAGR